MVHPFKTINAETTGKNVDELMDYVETTFVKSRQARGQRSAETPGFVPDVWNVYSAVSGVKELTMLFKIDTVNFRKYDCAKSTILSFGSA
jgi:hypothetical protein